MNILYLTYDYPPNPQWGMGVHVEELVKHLRSRGHRVMIGGVDRYGLLGGYEKGAIFNACTKSVPDNIAEKMCTCWLKTDVHCYDTLGATVLRKMKEADFRPDLVHIHGWVMARTARAVKEALGVPVLSTIHFLDIQYDNMKTEHPGGAWQKSEYFLREEEMMSVSDYLLSISEFGRKLLLSAYPKHLHKTRVIKHGIELDRLERAEIVRPKKERPMVTFVGRVVQNEKGVEYFCEAMSHECFRNKVDVSVIGTGILLEELKARYGKEIEFTGYIPRAEVKKRVLSSDFMVLPSMEEHFGLVALEAMSLGAVPITSNSGAFPEFIADRENGFLFDVDSRDGKPYVDAAKLRAAVLTALATPAEVLNEMRLRNHTLVKERYSLERMAEDTFSYYLDITSANAKGPKD